MWSLLQGLRDGLTKTEQPTPEPTQAAPSVHICRECGGSFSSQEALGAHLLLHNQLRAFVGATTAAPAPSQPQVAPTAPAPSQAQVAPTAAVPPKTVKRVVSQKDDSKGGVKQDTATRGTPLPPKLRGAVESVEQPGEADSRPAPATVASRTRHRQTGPDKTTTGGRLRDTMSINTSPPPPPPGDLVMIALMRAMQMVANSPRANAETPALREKSTGARGRTRSRAKSVDYSPEDYQAMIESLSSSRDGARSVQAGIRMLGRTQLLKAYNIEAMPDRQTQAMLLIIELENERDECQRRVLLERQERAGDELASRLGLHANGEPEPPQTMYCGICMDNVEIEDIIFVTGCDHTYCRICFHRFVIDRIDARVVMPTCPHDGCATVVSDGDLTLVLTIEEQLKYYKTCQDIAIANEPGLFQCLQTDCRGIAALPPDDPHFVCPLCRAERCVQCNTREWHAELTCEQRRQRDKDNELHAEQIHQIYGDTNLFQCAQCSYGPVERKDCPNLAAHHNELVNGVRINNACPRCNWFADDSSQWHPWNGQLHAALPTEPFHA